MSSLEYFHHFRVQASYRRRDQWKKGRDIKGYTINQQKSNFSNLFTADRPIIMYYIFPDCQKDFKHSSSQNDKYMR